MGKVMVFVSHTKQKFGICSPSLAWFKVKRQTLGRCIPFHLIFEPMMTVLLLWITENRQSPDWSRPDFAWRHKIHCWVKNERSSHKSFACLEKSKNWSHKVIFFPKRQSETCARKWDSHPCSKKDPSSRLRRGALEKVHAMTFGFYSAKRSYFPALTIEKPRRPFSLVCLLIFFPLSNDQRRWVMQIFIRNELSSDKSKERKSKAKQSTKEASLMQEDLSRKQK